jgi:hypothetical protein
MTSTLKLRSQGRSRARRSGKDRYRTLGACAILAGILALADMGGKYLPLEQMLSPQQPIGAETRYATGSIIIVPTEGNICRQRLIDNATGRIRDKGDVDCDSALSLKYVPVAASRMASIRAGFGSK